MGAWDRNIEDILLTRSRRGMERVRRVLAEGYCRRAARILLDNPGTVIVGTGFPVGDTFETDGPVGAIGLYRVMAHLGSRPVFVCAPPISRALADCFEVREIPVRGRRETLPVVLGLLADLRPAVVVSIERPGAAADGRYYNMRGRDISAATARFDLLFEHAGVPTVAFGDGGNEIGMGNVTDALAGLDVIPSVTASDELVVATVSNWGVYGVVAAMSRELGQDLFDLFDPLEILAYLLKNGSVDGVTARPEPTEDGLSAAVGLSVIARLRDQVAAAARGETG